MSFSKLPVSARITLALTIALILFLVFLNLLGPAFNPLILGFQILPLILTVPGQLGGKARAYQWLCFIVLFFFVQGVLLIFTPGWLPAGILETGICCLLFVFAIIFIRQAGQGRPS